MYRVHVPNAVVTCEIRLFQNYFSFCRRPSEIRLFQGVETCLKLFQNYFRRLLQLAANIVQRVPCSRNNFEIIFFKTLSVAEIIWFQLQTRETKHGNNFEIISEIILLRFKSLIYSRAGAIVTTFQQLQQYTTNGVREETKEDVKVITILGSVRRRRGWSGTERTARQLSWSAERVIRTCSCMTAMTTPSAISAVTISTRNSAYCSTSTHRPRVRTHNSRHLSAAAHCPHTSIQRSPLLQ